MVPANIAGLTSSHSAYYPFPRGTLDIPGRKLCGFSLRTENKRNHDIATPYSNFPLPGGHCVILQDHGDHLILIRQTDHALLAGFFAREWGNERFTRPEPFDSFRLAAAEHDNGWSDWEQHPQVDSATFSPYSFMSIPTAEHIEIYKRGIDRIVQQDRYAGLLAANHAAGLYDRARATIPGFSAKYVKTNEAQLVADFVQRLRLQQLRLKVDLRADAALQPFIEDKAVQRNALRLEALDRLSLYFCLAPPAEYTIDAVPVDEQGAEADLELRPQSDDAKGEQAGERPASASRNAVVLTPYPFRRDPLDISILVRRIPKQRYGNEFDLQRELAMAKFYPLYFTLSASNADTRARAAGM
jgi:hypothetical protein